MKLKRIIGISALVFVAISIVSCGKDSGEKEAPNTISYKDAAGEDKELVVNKTDDKNEAKAAAEALILASSGNEEFQIKKGSLKSVKLVESGNDKTTLSVNSSGVETVTTSSVEQKNNRLINFEQKKMKLEASGTTKTKMKIKYDGESDSATSKAKSNATSYTQFYENNAITILDGEVSSSGKTQAVRYYTDTDIKFEEFENYDILNLDRLYNYMLPTGDLVAITSTTKSSITFEFNYSYDRNFMLQVLGDDSGTKSMINYGLFDSLFSGIELEVTINTESFLPTKITTESECENIDLRSFYRNEMNISVSSALMDIEYDITYKLEYGNVSIGKVVDTSGYPKK